MMYARTMMPGTVSAMGKVYEEVAALAYQRVSKEAFQWLPQWVLSLMEMCIRDRLGDTSALGAVTEQVNGKTAYEALF